MNQNKWGPPLWYFLHTCTFNYPIKPTLKDKQETLNLFMCLKPTLPCSYCRVNYARNLREFPIKLSCRKDLVCWLIDLHNEVNTLTGKKHYSYEEVLRDYEQKLGKKISLTDDDSKLNLTCGTHCWKTINIFFFISVMLILLFIGMKYKKKLFRF